MLSTVVGAGVFATLTQQLSDNKPMKIVIALTSLAAAVLSGLQTFLGSDKLAEKHHKAAVEYGVICFEIETNKALRTSSQLKPEDLLSETKDRLEALERESPEFPLSVWNKWKGRFKALEH
jgi:hypothetical protein